MALYDIKYKKLALLLLPVLWRKPLIAGITFAVITPLNYLQALLMSFRTDTNYRLTHNGQVCYLRAVINDMFDPGLRRITIGDTDITEFTNIIHLRDLNLAKIVPARNSGNAVIINRRGFGGASGFDFLINMPTELIVEIDLNRLAAVVNMYKLASKRFAINYV